MSNILFETDGETMRSILDMEAQINQRNLMVLYLGAKSAKDQQFKDQIEQMWNFTNTLSEAEKLNLMKDPLFTFWLNQASSYLHASEPESIVYDVISSQSVITAGYSLNNPTFTDEVKVTSDSQGRIPLFPLGILIKVQPYTSVYLKRNSLNFPSKEGMTSIEFEANNHCIWVSSDAHIERIPSVPLLSSQFSYHDWFIEGFQKTVFDSYSNEEMAKRYSLESSVIEPKSTELTGLKNAIESIKCVWPEEFEILNTLLKIIVPIKGRVVGHSTSCFTGTIFIQIYDNYADTAENLIHEVNHLLLDVVLMKTPLTTNKETSLFKSPWRPDLRPITGILHGTYVYYQIANYYDRLRCQDSEVIPRFKTIVSKLSDGYNSLLEYGEFTDEGTSTMNRLGKEVNRLTKVINSL
ncbi:aKG-HExxH-type peptide beta-hydroxylase [Bacillus sp. SD088]|uniref:aKG-HExxH-type peptide beta-hydroxylase n=1 Tax=Bacillus sp. SD088 TaxID=2782012 RepID=UPI001A95758C|nr:HEXXH motif-containing putative peptide modification protein [Bacillus sp. SD088]MBO0995915.1 hypothetical protein [Bacillus sp. SD088]